MNTGWLNVIKYWLMRLDKRMKWEIVKKMHCFHYAVGRIQVNTSHLGRKTALDNSSAPFKGKWFSDESVPQVKRTPDQTVASRLSLSLPLPNPRPGELLLLQQLLPNFPSV